MERDYLEWINKSYKLLIENHDCAQYYLGLPDGSISVYRKGDSICVEISRKETKKCI